MATGSEVSFAPAKWLRFLSLRLSYTPSASASPGNHPSALAYTRVYIRGDPNSVPVKNTPFHPSTQRRSNPGGTRRGSILSSVAFVEYALAFETRSEQIRGIFYTRRLFRDQRKARKNNSTPFTRDSSIGVELKRHGGADNSRVVRRWFQGEPRG